MANPYFEMGVAVRIKNHKFRFPSRISTTLSSAYTSGTTISISDSSNYYKHIDRYDSFSIGESSNSSDEGKSETGTILSVSNSGGATVLTIDSPLSYDYELGDSIVIYGAKHPNNWSLSSSPARTPIAINPPSGSEKDRYSMMQEAPEGNIGRGGIKQEFDSNPFKESTCYRVGCVYKYFVQNASGDAKMILLVNDGDDWVIWNGTINSNQLNWTRKTVGSKNTISAADLSSASGAYIELAQYLDGSVDYSFLSIDDIFLEHAKEIYPKKMILLDTEYLYMGFLVVFDNSEFSVGDDVIIHGYDLNSSQWKNIVREIAGVSGDGATLELSTGSTEKFRAGDGWVEKVSNGYYEFSELPSANSIKYQSQDNPKYLDLSPNLVKKVTQHFGDKTERYIFQCIFRNVPRSFYEKLLVFKRWQDRGNLLNFHPFLDDLPNVMTGYMELRDFGKGEHWDLTRRTFQFNFIEAVV